MRFILAILIVFFSTDCSAFWTKGTDTAPEVQTFCKRVLDDGGTVIDIEYMDKTVKLLKQLGIWGNVKFLGDANMGVQLDATGVSVQKLYDLSGNNNDATQGTVAAQPVWTANVQGGRYGIVFDGNDSLYSAAYSSDLSQPNTILIVLKPVAFTDVTLFVDGIVTTKRNAIYYPNDTSRESLFASNLTLSSTTSGSTGVETRLLTGIFNAGSSSLFSKGMSIATGTVSAAVMSGVRIGSAYDGAYPLTGWISPVMVINAGISTTQRTAIESMINHYYSIY